MPRTVQTRPSIGHEMGRIEARRHHDIRLERQQHRPYIVIDVNVAAPVVDERLVQERMRKLRLSQVPRTIRFTPTAIHHMEIEVGLARQQAINRQPIWRWDIGDDN